MPTYEYVCNACKENFEEFQKITDPVIKKCPFCGKKKVERLVSATAFQLKGGGWYSSGYSDPRPSPKKKEE